ncbi:MAG TPA: tripartite tricarboxylate transporter substrate binding protein [Burkholderiales bacterium]|nr:tripartite tricarboxylate transporter substrate binding protein [Burkholderiales bacterium]
MRPGRSRWGFVRQKWFRSETKTKRITCRSAPSTGHVETHHSTGRLPMRNTCGFSTRTAFAWLAIFAVHLLVATASPAAEPYPSRPVRVIVPFSPGGGADVIARMVFTRVSAHVGQPFIIDNRGSAGGIVGTDAVTKAAPDGYTILLGQTGPNAINPALFAKLPYDPVADLAPVTQLTTYPYVIAENPAAPAKTLKELVAQAKEKPNTVSFGTAGTGSSAQLVAELLMRAAGISLVHIPYKGGGPALADAVGNVVTLVFADTAATTPFVHSGRLRALAVTGPHRSPLLPDTPTLAEAGYAAAEASVWHAVYAPAQTPPEIIRKLNSELGMVLKDPEVRDRLAKDGYELVGSTPEAFGAFTAAEIKKWGDIVRVANIKLQ